jgi:membrane protein YdbS with pleckstrin-like domain
MSVEPAEASEDGQRPLDPRFIPHQRVVGRIVSACVGVGLLVGAIATTPAAWSRWWALAAILAGWVIVVIFLVWMSERWPVIEYRYIRYRVDAEGLQIRRGVWWRHIINVPRSRIQHTDVSQGPLERRYGLGTLVVHTAGTQHARVELGGLDHASAINIRDYLLPRDTHDAV